MRAPLPPNEEQRLRVLRLFRILDTESEKSFDDLTRLAAAICDTPIGVITLLDEDRQWFKSRVGLSASETSREVAFCAHAILQDDVLIVRDASDDPRFADNPLVTSDPSVRFYAGAPLVVTGGASLGTLCVIDFKPRQLTAAQLDALKILRHAVVTQLELRRAVGDLRALEQLIPICANCRSVRYPDGSWTFLDNDLARPAQLSHVLCPDCSAHVAKRAV